MARMTLLVAGVVVVLFCFLEIHAVIIAQRDDKSSSSTNTNSQPQPPTPLPVPWQTAFGILLTFALNAMTQNSTFDRNFPSGILFPMRSSPLVCATDMLDVLLQLLVYMYAGASAPEAARRVVRKRMWRPPRSSAVATASADDNNSGEETIDSPQLTLGDQHPRAHIVVFILTILPQAIKLFGMCGIPWTQACGGLYLTSFLMIAGVGALARYADGDTDGDTSWEGALVEPTMEVWNFASFWVVAVVQAEVWVWCVTELLYPVWDMKAKALVWYIILLAPLWFMPMMLVFVPTTFLIPPLFRTTLIPTTYNILAYLAFSVSLLFPEDYLLFSVYVLLAAFIATKVVLPHLLMIFFGLVNLALSILYYRFRYDPTGTVKPLWTEMLG